VAVAGLGRDEPTLLLANHVATTARDRILRYPGRDGVEDCPGSSVNCFHLDCLASEVRRNGDLDVALTGIAHGCSRWLARKRRGLDKAKPKQRDRRCIETGGGVTVAAERIGVSVDQRSHNRWLREAARDGPCPPIPWLGNRVVTFDYP
jgi:hypothetical protein